MTTTDDPRMGEFEDLLGVLLVEAQSVAVGEQSAAVAAERKRALRAWATAQMKRLDTLAAFARTAPGRLPAEVQAAVDSVPWDGEAVRRVASPPPAGERAELVKRLREEARTWRELIEEEAVGSRLDKPAFYFERTIALLDNAADALEAGLANSPTEPASSLASRVDQLAARVAELEDRVERLGDDSQEHHDRLWTLEDRYDRLDGIDRELGEANRAAFNAMDIGNCGSGLTVGPTPDSASTGSSVVDAAPGIADLEAMMTQARSAGGAISIADNRLPHAKGAETPDSAAIADELDAALLALYLEGVQTGVESVEDHRSTVPGLSQQRLAQFADIDGRADWYDSKPWPARDRVRALLNERREG